MMAYCRIAEGDRVFDWGCGWGTKLRWLSVQKHIVPLGVDLLDQCIAEAQRNMPTGLFCAGDGRKLAWLPSESIDAVMSFGAIYHLAHADQCDVVKELIRMLVPGGRLMSSFIPVRYSPFELWHNCFAGRDDIAYNVTTSFKVFGNTKYKQDVNIGNKWEIYTIMVEKAQAS
jgi:2-polyprenyl-3-methyl-5-hydroxy-6-metoxy-1,4-benzoquinol methylase